jgi:hypothetical protein
LLLKHNQKNIIKNSTNKYDLAKNHLAEDLVGPCVP